MNSRPLSFVAAVVVLAGGLMLGRRLFVSPDARPGAAALAETVRDTSTRPLVAGGKLATRPDRSARAAAERAQNREDGMREPDWPAVHRRVQEIGAAPEGPARDGMWQDLGVDFAAGNTAWSERALAEIADPRAKGLFVRALVEALARQRPAQAAAWSETLREPALRDTALTVVGMTWADSDRERARDWALGLADDAGRSRAIEGVTWSWAQSDPLAVYQWATELPDAALRSEVLAKTVKVVALRDPGAAADWAAKLPAGETAAEALGYAMFQWAGQDLAAAVAWLAHAPDENRRTAAEIAVGSAWAAQEPKGATQWAAGIVEPATQLAALKTTVTRWAENDPAQAAAWLSARAASGGTDELFRHVTSTLAQRRPAAANAWLAATANPAWRSAGATILGDVRALRPKPSG